MNRREFLQSSLTAAVAVGIGGCAACGTATSAKNHSGQSPIVNKLRKEKKGTHMDKRELITYCGLYCSLCAERSRIPEKARGLIAALEIEGYPHWAGSLPEFNEFWTFINRLVENAEKRCCKSGTCGSPACSIRKCAKKRGVEICDQCPDFPCKRIHGIAKGYPTLLYDAKRRQEIGVDAWIEEQEKRLRTGFQYADIRCDPYEVPSE